MWIILFIRWTFICCICQLRVYQGTSRAIKTCIFIYLSRDRRPGYDPSSVWSIRNFITGHPIRRKARRGLITPVANCVKLSRHQNFDIFFFILLDTRAIKFEFKNKISKSNFVNTEALNLRNLRLELFYFLNWKKKQKKMQIIIKIFPRVI